MSLVLHVTERVAGFGFFLGHVILGDRRVVAVEREGGVNGGEAYLTWPTVDFTQWKVTVGSIYCWCLRNTLALISLQ